MPVTTCANIECNTEITITGDGRYPTYHHPTEGGKYFCCEACKQRQLPREQLSGVVVGLPKDQRTTFHSYSELSRIIKD